ncbi:MAG: hypothetical protein QM796_17805 [Chthoniobacteraceae bacterium]
MAVFDAVLFPLLALDFGLAWFLHELGLALHLWTQNSDPVSNAVLAVSSILAWGLVDWWIVRMVWNVVKPPGTSSIESVPKSFWRRNVGMIAIGCLLLLVLAASAVFHPGGTPRQAAAENAATPPMPAPSATPVPDLTTMDEKPVLRFLAWQGRPGEEGQMDIRHPDGSKVTDARELRWLKQIPTGSLGGDDQHAQPPRVLHFWFSHPLFNAASLKEIAVIDQLDPNTTKVLNGPEVCSTATETDDGPHLGWFALATKLRAGLSISKRVTVQLRYTAGPLEHPREMVVNPHARSSMSLEGGADFSVIGQTIDNQAFAVLTVPAAAARTRQFSVEAVTNDGRQLICGPSISGIGDGNLNRGVQTPVRHSRTSKNSSRARDRSKPWSGGRSCSQVRQVERPSWIRRKMARPRNIFPAAPFN